MKKLHQETEVFDGFSQSDKRERRGASQTIKQLDRESDEALKDRSHQGYEARKIFLRRQKELKSKSDERNFQYDYEVKDNSTERGR